MGEAAVLSWEEQQAPLERGSAVAAQSLLAVDALIESVLLQTPKIGTWTRDAAGLAAAARTILLRLERLDVELRAAEPNIATATAGADGDDDARWAHRMVSIAGGVSFEVTMDRAARDPVTTELAGGHFIEEAMVSLMLTLLRPGQILLDLGAHLGGFSLAAAAAGARVIAVEASPHNAAALRIAARRNRFHRLLVVEAAVSDAPGTLHFLPSGPFGQIVEEAGEATVSVPAVTASELVEEVGWGPVAFVKIDVEGAELPAFSGMRALLAGPDAPPVLYESNGYLLAGQGQRTQDLVAYLDGLGYTSYLVDSAAGCLIRVPPQEIQPEAVTDYLALKRVPAELLALGWQVREGSSIEDLAARVVTESRHPLPQHRGYILNVLRDADPTLLAHPAVAEALEALLAENL